MGMSACGFCLMADHISPLFLAAFGLFLPLKSVMWNPLIVVNLPLSVLRLIEWIPKLEFYCSDIQAINSGAPVPWSTWYLLVPPPPISMWSFFVEGATTLSIQSNTADVFEFYIFLICSTSVLPNFVSTFCLVEVEVEGSWERSDIFLKHWRNP